jgi:hypothetical protein
LAPSVDDSVSEKHTFSIFSPKVVNVLEKHTVSIFRAEDGDCMCLRNIVICLCPHGITTEKTNINIFTAGRNSNLIIIDIVLIYLVTEQKQLKNQVAPAASMNLK